MSDRTRVAAFWRERTIIDRELVERVELNLDTQDRPALEALRKTNPVEAARLSREGRAGGPARG